MNIPMTRDAVRSDEEWAMVLWLQEATKNNLVKSWDYEAYAITLFKSAKYIETVHMKTKSKCVERHLLRGASYTPDFVFDLTELGVKCFAKEFKASIHTNGGTMVVVDVKGGFQPSSFGSDGRYFSLIQKCMFHLNGIYVQKIVPKKLFAKTFCPESLRWMKNRREPTLTVAGKRCNNVGSFVSNDGCQSEGAERAID